MQVFMVNACASRRKWIKCWNIIAVNKAIITVVVVFVSLVECSFFWKNLKFVRYSLMDVEVLIGWDGCNWDDISVLKDVFWLILFTKAHIFFELIFSAFFESKFLCIFLRWIVENYLKSNITSNLTHISITIQYLFPQFTFSPLKQCKLLIQLHLF